MKEVGEKRIVGPFAEIPFANYIQSPIGLVPKAGGKTRLIFHLSFAFSERPEDQSVNQFIPKEWCSVKYSDLDAPVQACLSASSHAQATTGSSQIFLGKSDALSAFCMLLLSR